MTIRMLLLLFVLSGAIILSTPDPVCLACYQATWVVRAP